MDYETGEFIKDGELMHGCFLVYGGIQCNTHSEALEKCQERDFCYQVTDQYGTIVNKVYFCGYCGSELGNDGDCHNKNCEAGN